MKVNLNSPVTHAIFDLAFIGFVVGVALCLMRFTRVGLWFYIPSGLILIGLGFEMCRQIARRTR